MAFEGMNPDQVEQYGHQLLTEAGNIGHLISTIQSNVSTLGTNWLGTDSDQFQQEWSNTYLRQMQNAQESLQKLGNVALQNASEQRSTSSHL
jgi:WXG100 family type VII secretion target